MKNNNNDWIDAVRRKVDSNEAPLPSDGWEAIERALDAQEQGNIVPLRRRVLRWSVAAAAVILVAATTLWLMVPRNEIQVSVSDAAIAKTETSTDIKSNSTPVIAPSASASSLALQVSSVPNMASISATSQKKSSDLLAVAEVLDEEKKEKYTEQSIQDNDSKASVKDEDSQPRKTLRQQLAENPASNPLAMNSRTSQRDSRGGDVNIFASGDFVGATNGNSTREMVYLANTFDGAFVPRVEPKHYSYKHKQPISVGLKFSKHLPHNLALSIGINYTLLRSDVLEEDTRREFSQKLQFVGIPLGVNWTFARYKRLSAYVGAEAEAERCVDARFDGESKSIKKIQWSIHGLAGARLALTDNLSIYAEPKISHYITELPLKTIRDEHDVNFNLQVGLTFNY